QLKAFRQWRPGPVRLTVRLTVLGRNEDQSVPPDVRLTGPLDSDKRACLVGEREERVSCGRLVGRGCEARLETRACAALCGARSPRLPSRNGWLFPARHGLDRWTGALAARYDQQQTDSPEPVASQSSDHGAYHPPWGGGSGCTAAQAGLSVWVISVVRPFA